MAYAEAGANGFFVPGLTDDDAIAQLYWMTPLPVNIMIMDGAPPIPRLAELGVARVSYGPLPFAELAQQLEENARRVFTS
jgi:2-methylisocitrate lyase-like PEP mutase family enzyme